MVQYLAAILRNLKNLCIELFIKAVLYITDGFLIAGGGLIGPIFALYVEHVGGSVVEVGTAFTIFAMTAGIGTLIFCRIEDRHKAKMAQYVAIGYFIAMLAYIGYMLVTDIVGVYIIQFMLGLSAAIRLAAYDVLLTNKSPRHVAVSWGNWNAIAFLVSGAAAIVGSSIVAFYGFPTLLIIMAVFSLLSFLTSLLLLRVKVHEAVNI